VESDGVRLSKKVKEAAKKVAENSSKQGINAFFDFSCFFDCPFPADRVCGLSRGVRSTLVKKPKKLKKE